MKPALFAAVILFLVLLFIIVMILNSMRLAAGRKIHNDINRMLSVYDRLIDRKSFKLEKLKKLTDDMTQKTMLIQPIKQSQAAEQAAPELPYTIINAKYKSGHYAHSYKRMKQAFQFDRQAVIETLKARTQQKEDDLLTLLAPVKELLDVVRFDHWYQLAQLPAGQQRELLLQILQKYAIDTRVIREFENQVGLETVEMFDCLSFRQWLREYTHVCSDTIIIRTGELPPEQATAEPGIALQYNEDICEGFQIVIGNKLYDYSICDSEI